MALPTEPTVIRTSEYGGQLLRLIARRVCFYWSGTETVPGMPGYAFVSAAELFYYGGLAESVRAELRLSYVKDEQLYEFWLKFYRERIELGVEDAVTKQPVSDDLVVRRFLYDTWSHQPRPR